MFRLSRLLSNTTALSLLIVGAVSANTAWADPSGRVAYMSDVQGAISYSPAGIDAWVNVERNRPLIQGDRLWSDQDSRAEFQIGSSAYRLGDNTSLEIMDLNDHIAQLRLTQGSVNISVRRIYKGQTIEIDTPLLAFTIKRRGLYRIDVDPYDGETTVSVWKGSGRAYGHHSKFNVKAGESVVFYDSSLSDFEVYGVSAYDEFDQYALQRDERYTQSASLQYVNDDLVGYAELDTYGSWSSVNTYGNVWFPTRVSAGWAPYSDGYWVWQEPWGWTWVDNAPWGFAPSHYGRWVLVRNRWAWVPGPRQVRPIYAPALVAFVGGSGWSLSVSVGGGVAPIGWFPIGPREVYVPSYRVSQDYFTRVNVNNTVVNNTTITNVYNNYSSGDINVNQVNYANRNVESAITAVPSNVFVNAQSTGKARLKVDRKALSTGEVTRIAPLAPDQNSVLGAGKAVKNQPKRDVFDRQVVAHNAPPPAPVAFSKREKQLQKQPGRALEPEAVAVMADDNKQAQRKVRVVSDQAESVDARVKSKGRSVKEDPSGKPQQLDRSTADRKAKKPAKTDGAETVTPKQDRSDKQAAEQQQQQKANADKKTDSDKRAAQQQQKADSDKRAAQQQQKADSDQKAARQQQQKADSDKRAAEQQQQKAVSDQKAARQQQQKADSDKRAAEQQQQKADSDQKAARQQQQKADSDKRAAEQQQQKADSDQKAARQQQQKADSDKRAAEQQQQKANADKKADSDKRAAQQQQKADSDQKAARQQQQKADSDKRAAQQQQKADTDKRAAQQQQKAARQPPNTQNQPAADSTAERQGQPSDRNGKSTKSKSQAQCEREAKKQHQDPSVCQADS